MSEIHVFTRPDLPSDSRRIGEPYSPDYNRYDEGVRYLYKNGAHDLTLFWSGPSPAELAGLRDRPVTVGLYDHGPAAFLLYKVDDVCEWSDAAFNVHLVPEGERELPAEPTGERSRLIITLVDADDGIIKGRRLVSLDKVMTQSLRHVMATQAEAPFVRPLYDIAVQETYARFPDTDAMAEAAEIIEAALG
ncbi:hypothetical protein EZJ19_13970 [Parasulfuritortus cantonensis]|uniref:Uncharacterized protein n=1 Tax=Parasulfuritortus cantonensis TaxID=2528202 RepID=A0A4R1B175_9PROT|nr:hypothetical protein [Parasulfuritortus cantonensis]TCJ11762.1 hypothetical protein EZJ19_13970 [Parasulfuritortus cantonensis]